MSELPRFLSTRRPTDALDRDAIRARNARAFAAGDQARRIDTAERLRALADDVRAGRVSPLVLAQVEAVLTLAARGRG